MKQVSVFIYWLYYVISAFTVRYNFQSDIPELSDIDFYLLFLVSFLFFETWKIVFEFSFFNLTHQYSSCIVDTGNFSQQGKKDFIILID